ncbi:MAG: LysM peptidoglycan-binding domain-containing protein [Chloroflexota bacterium]
MQKVATRTPATQQLRATLVAATPTAQPSPTALPTPTPEPLPTMEVRAGDTLLELAVYYNVTPFDIASVNGFSVDDYLQIGEALAIPVSSANFSIPPDPNFVAAIPAADDSPAIASEPDPEPEPQPTPPPTPEPTPPPTPYIPPSGSDVVAAICSLPWPCDQMVRIASCESGLNPRAVNPAGYYGIFQISEQIAGWDDALTNATYAYYSKYAPAEARGDALAPWPVCRYY